MALKGATTEAATLLDRDRRGDERSRPPAAVGVLDRRDDARGPRILVEQRTHEDDLAGRPLRKAPQRDGDGLSFPDHRQVGRGNRQFDPDAAEIDDDEEFGFEIVATDGRPEFDLAFGDPSGDRRTDVLAAQRGVRRLGKRRDLVLPHAQRQQLLARDSEPHRGLRRRVARFDVLLFRNGAALPERFVPSGQILLQVVREPGRQIFALGVGDLAALEDGEDLVLDDVVADVLAQFGDRARELDRDMGHPAGIGHDGSGHAEALCDRGGPDASLFDLGELDPLVVHRHDRGLSFGAVRFGFALRDGRRHADTYHAL